MNLQQLARALCGEVTSGGVSCPGPGHSSNDRSLRVFLNSLAPDGFRTDSMAGDDFRACRDYVKARLGIDDRSYEVSRRRDNPYTEHPKTDDASRIIRALSIWGESRPLDGTVGLTYLARRGVDVQQLPAGLHGALRWHPACPWESGTHGCVVALMIDAITGEPKAIHRTAITADGRKIGKKMMGPCAGCIICLWPDDAVTDGLVLGEGIETTLVAATRIEHRGTCLAPAWAAGSAGAMAKFPVLAGIETLTILVDNDESGAGQRAAAECSDRWTAAGREVVRLVPDAIGADFVDLGERAA